MYPHLPGARNIDLLEALRETVRDFCKDTKAFSEELGPISIVDWRRDYDLSDHHYYTAQIHQLKRVWLNGIEQGDDEFSLRRDRWLRWDDMHVPHDLDDALLTWRHKHVVTVERIIGRRRGTGGTEGAAYLASTLTKRCFPELWSLRTKL